MTSVDQPEVLDAIKSGQAQATSAGERPISITFHNQTGFPVAFQFVSFQHGTTPSCSSQVLKQGDTATVSATSTSSVAPGTEGVFSWDIENGQGYAYAFAYNHPNTSLQSQILSYSPPGFTCQIDDSGLQQQNATATITLQPAT